MKEFAEGNMSIQTFWEELNKNSNIIQLLQKNNKKSAKTNFYYDEYHILNNFNINSLSARVELFRLVRNYFKIRKININYYNLDEKNYELYNAIIPEWLDIIEDPLFNRILAEISNELPEKEFKESLSGRIRDLFKYDLYPPEWLQNPKWPIINDKPLTFKYQDGEVEKEDCISYIFYDFDTKEEFKIIQYS